MILNAHSTINPSVHFARQGTSIFINNNSTPLAKLPAATFTIEVTPQGVLYLEQVPDLAGPTELYGDVEQRVERIMSTFDARPGNTGILLSGEKGSGKTLLARLLCVSGRRLGMPTIMLTKALPGDVLINFLKSVDQPYVLFIDEFEKMYSGRAKGDDSAQTSLLTLFDGSLATKRLTVVTCNDLWNVSSYMRNRPGRFFYHFEYDGLDEDFVRHYCSKNLKAQEHTDSVVALALMFNAFNFDMLQAVVEEMNRYGETAGEACRFLNVMPHRERMSWEVEDIEIKPAVLERWMNHMRVISSSTQEALDKMPESERKFTKVTGFFYDDDDGTNPLEEPISVNCTPYLKGAPLGQHGVELHPDEIVSFKGGRVEYESEEFGKLALVRKKKRTMNYNSLAF